MKTDQLSDQTTAQITIPLDLPGVRVLEVELNDQGDFLISVESTLDGTTCRQCGQVTTQWHGLDEPITLRHLPILGHRVDLRWRPKRDRCPRCEGGPTTTQRLEWYTPKSPHTQADERHLLWQLVNSTLEDVRLKEALL
jgi:transposase